MGKITINLIKCILAVLIFGIVALFVLWVPSLHKYVEEILAQSNANLNFLCYLVYPLCTLIAMPALALVAVAFRFPRAIERDEIFSTGTAKRLKLISNLIFISCAAGFTSVILLFIIGERVLSPLLFFAFFIGFTLGLMLAVVSDYVKRAAILKEEVDHTL